MHFVFILTNLAGGGAEKAVLKTACGLLGRGHRVDLVLLENVADYDMPDAVSCHVLGQHLSHGWLGKRFLAYRLKKCIDRFLPDLVVSTLPFADEVAMLAGVPRHCCRIANTVTAEIDRLERSSPAKARRRRARYQALYGQRPLIAVSQGVATDLRTNLQIKSPVTVIPNPFDLSLIRQMAKEATPDLPNHRYVIHVGRFSGQKRHDLLLNAWQKTPVDIILVLLTQKDEQLVRMIAERGLQERVRIAGFKKNPYPWIARAALLVLCSDHEGLPNVLIEALACGTPVISTDCPSGPREILGEDLPDTLIPCGDAKILAERINQFLTKPPDISNVDLDHFGVERTIEAYEKLARSMA